MGYKEIEIGFPSASQTDFDFVRQLIEGDKIPDDVTVSVLTQAREDLIERTAQSLVGARSATIHMYNATAPLFRRVVFRVDKAECMAIATHGTELVMKYAEQHLGDVEFGYQYSPEIFTGTEPDFAVEICNAVMDVWQPGEGREIILNLPATVEMSTPEHVRGPDRVVRPPGAQPRPRGHLAAPAQRPRHRRRRHRAGRDGRRRPGRGLPVRSRRADRQRRPGHPGHEPVLARHRPADRLLRHRRDPSHGGVLHQPAGPPAPPVRGGPGLHRLLRLPPGRHQEGPGGPGQAGRRAGDPRGRDGVGGAVPADRPARRRPHLRGRHPGQLAVRQGRRRVHHEDRAQPGPAAPAADRVLPGGPGLHRRRRRRGQHRCRSGQCSSRPI